MGGYVIGLLKGLVVVLDRNKLGVNKVSGPV